MDSEQARTFLTVVAVGSFVRAAQELNVTQSTVSTRIKTLEERLGCQLFVRSKAGTRLTPQGERFQRHAAVMVRTVEQARIDIGTVKDYRHTLTVGGRFGLWEQFLLRWLAVMRARAPEIAVRAEIGFETDLMQSLTEGRLDAGVMYTPQSRPGFTVEHLFNERLVLAGTAPQGGRAVGADYVYVDWGPEFHARHCASFPEFTGAAISVNIGWLGLQYVLRQGGSGYFPFRLIRAHVEAGNLHVWTQAPSFELPAHVVLSSSVEPALAARLKEALRAVAAEAC